ncbi:malonyl-CoA decarboxylase [Polymorphum gilvum]|uniref:Malonyl-CoA decarboxylase protein n=1 Tax=Polymorphum gilvum (strain LMG 25793 / CGMCC 1.9160 / SL003B-26A1) TaxID=991905 RepID=F2IWB2_POLGS|nr:malonyl-CoA decarboxylase [Polymorphum gilvum]ADZ71497.1 Malonyl-CoA decarboxylase protein [Polymorphum gilvum SL003B-26A1]
MTTRNTSFFRELLTSIAEQGRQFLDPRRNRESGETPVVDLCEALLSGRGEASGVALAGDVLAGYRMLARAGRAAFFTALLTRFGADIAEVSEVADALRIDPGNLTLLRRLHDVSEPRRQELIRRLNLAPGGTRALVDMRADLLDHLAEHPDLREVDRDFEHLFSSWFNRGFLVMQRIDWSTPAAILEKIIRYEAVHEIRDWDDLRRRIDVQDRRLYAFFHPALVDDPLIFVQVALTRDMPAAIAPILAEQRDQLRVDEAATAVFYSITNCQKGLRGISFGNFLIKQVVEELRRALPGLKTFVTLSPVPGFARWLEGQLASDDSPAAGMLSQEARALLAAPSWPEHADASLREPLTALGAHYLLREKDGRGRPIDPVARFHIGNGARLERVNWRGDLSPNGLAQAHGLMVNYLYDLKYIEKNHEAFAATGAVAASSQVTKLARAIPETRQPVPMDTK